MLDALKIDAGPFVIVLLIVTAIIGGVLYAMYVVIGRLIALIERHDR